MGRKEAIRENITKKSDHEWIINYQGAVCKFMSDTPDSAVIHDMEVPEVIRGNGIGSDIIEVVEETLRSETDVKVLHAQIGNDGGYTDYFLEEKAGFEVHQVMEKDSLGEVVDATKKI